MISVKIPVVKITCISAAAPPPQCSFLRFVLSYYSFNLHAASINSNIQQHYMCIITISVTLSPNGGGLTHHLLGVITLLLDTTC